MSINTQETNPQDTITSNMKIYEVVIVARIYKTIRVEAQDEVEAYEKAHDEFTVLPQEGVHEKYYEETLEIKETEAKTT